MLDLGLGIMLLGFMVGALVGLTGVGGAALLTPIMILFGVSPAIAIGTDLVYNSVTKFFGALQHFKQRTVNIKLVKWLAYGSIPGAVTSIGLLKLFDAFFNHQETVMKYALAVMLVLVASVVIFRQIFERFLKENRWQKKALEEKKMLMVAAGAVLGFVVGLTSIGSGSMFALVLLYFFRLKAAEIVGTDVAHAFLLVTVAGLMHAGLGNVNYLLALNLLAGSIPGVIIGSLASAKVPAKPLRMFMAGLILISGVMLI